MRDGSVLVTVSNKTLCRDTDETSHEVWYDPLFSASPVVGPGGTNQLAQATVLPPSGSLNVASHLYDRPGRWWPETWANPVVAGNPANFLHYVVTELLFCTMLVAQEPAGSFHVLMHFYWNVIWEHTFRRDSTGKVVADRAIRLQQNVQHPHAGNPHDSKFFGREFDLHLPVSNLVSRAQPRVVGAVDWGQG
ncbi:MAG: hypothetical protein FWD68_03965 [Alphaproteobacteria bacterium]|nr:hypothetical protein [Alphaproteobacteria bacterium]